MSRSDKKFTLFIGNLIPDITEETLRSFFSAYGEVTHVAIPRDRSSGRKRNYGFVHFASEEEALNTYQRCEQFTPRIDNIPVTVSWAYGSKTDKNFSPSRTRYSKSRSPRRPNDWRGKADNLSRKVEALQNEKQSLLDELSKVEKKSRTFKAMTEEVRAEIDKFKSQPLLSLPCGHSKLVQPKDKYLLNDLYKEAVSLLPTKEKTNKLVLKALKAKIFAIVETKDPDTYRCEQVETAILGACGHIVQLPCYQIREFSKHPYQCKEMVEKMLACGHKETVSCFKSSGLISCKLC